MSYQVLARKYRSRTFEELMGQEHVVQALSNALTQQRLHHAYLFTGTRGVGKTSVSRILAKSLNCTGADGQGGVTAQPCGVCPACRDIDAGRFVDYVELDAASNRGVEEISQLLDQAVYKPVVGRFKVYMIDEVHMLSNTAFNAMLKTLEEPPEYLKFVLATTDPQKVPVTVLSRCLQFNLRPMAPSTVLKHLTHVLSVENVPAEQGALRLLARAARGSMRDALSLTDQAIAFGCGQLQEATVRQMLGSVDRGHVLRILQALAQGDGPAVVGSVEQLRDLGLSASGTLEDLAVAFQNIAIAQAAPGALDAQDAELADLLPLAQALPADEVQLMYSMALHGRAELALAPDEYAGLTMVLLRMLAFRPQGPVTPTPAGGGSAGGGAPSAGNPGMSSGESGGSGGVAAASALAVQEAAAPALAPAAAVQSQPLAAPVVTPAATQPPPPAAAPQAAATVPAAAARAPAAGSRFSDRLRPRLSEAPAVAPEPAPVAERQPENSRAAAVQADEAPSDDGPPPWLDELPPAEDEAPSGPVQGVEELAESVQTDGGNGGIYVSTAAAAVALKLTELGQRWAELMPQLGLAALTRELAWQAECVAFDEGAQPLQCRLRVERESLRQSGLKDKLQAALAQHLGRPVQLEVEQGVAQDSPALRDTMADRERQQRAEAIILEDPEVQLLLSQYRSARIVPGSIKPV
ncbi:DNA polymerase III subunit gamma/tau [Roseateles sp. BYS180W]|uniref:DNA polymerase III subunit gamma/tau n=1 Tax=Roseateles rivi TaxID=3299028 RepID=A0ABW7FVN1_9BURK